MANRSDSQSTLEHRRANYAQRVPHEEEWQRLRPLALEGDYCKDKTIALFEFPKDTPNYVDTYKSFKYGIIGHVPWCFTYNYSLPPPAQQVAEIVLSKDLSKTGDFDYERLWVANSSLQPGPVLATFFDPLYATTTESDPCEVTNTGALEKKECYELLRDDWGKTVPAFYGLFLAELPFNYDYNPHSGNQIRKFYNHFTNRSRYVPVLLLQIFPESGRTFETIESNRFTPQARKKVWKEVQRQIDRFDSLGIYQSNIYPAHFKILNTKKARIGKRAPQIVMDKVHFVILAKSEDRKWMRESNRERSEEPGSWYSEWKQLGWTE